jgi:ABC-2 type transport system permease protein
MKRFWAIFEKEFRQIARDPLSLGLLIFVPALMLIMYGYALSFDVKHIKVAVLDYDQSQASRSFQDSLFKNPYFDHAGSLSRYSEVDDWLNHGKVRAVLVIPNNYSEKINRGETASIQALVDGANATSASTTVGYLEALAERVNRTVRMNIFKNGNMGVNSLPLVSLEPRIWYNPQMESAHFLVPGLIGMLLMLSSVIATSLSIVREKERETMEQIMVSPIRPYELILGKILPYIVICLITMVLILCLGYLLFGIVIQGSYWLLGLSTLVFLFAALGMGVLISSVTHSQQVAFQVATLATMLPSIILSGLIFPIQNMPLPIQILTLIVAPRHFVSLLRAVILKGAGLGIVWPDLLAMLVLGIVFNALAIVKTRKAI